MMMRFIVLLAIVMFLPFSAVFAGEMQDDIADLCAQVRADDQAACVDAQRSSFGAVQDYMNLIATSTHAYADDTGAGSLMISFMNCMDRNTLHGDLIDYVSMQHCIEGFSSARG